MRRAVAKRLERLKRRMADRRWTREKGNGDATPRRGCARLPLEPPRRRPGPRVPAIVVGSSHAASLEKPRFSCLSHRRLGAAEDPVPQAPPPAAANSVCLLDIRPAQEAAGTSFCGFTVGCESKGLDT